MIVNNSTNINKANESLNSDGQQFLQYQKKKKKSLKSDSQQFLHYQQNKRKLKQWLSTIPPISTKQTKV